MAWRPAARAHLHAVPHIIPCQLHPSSLPLTHMCNSFLPAQCTWSGRCQSRRWGSPASAGSTCARGGARGAVANAVKSRAGLHPCSVALPSGLCALAVRRWQWSVPPHAPVLLAQRPGARQQAQRVVLCADVAGIQRLCPAAVVQHPAAVGAARQRSAAAVRPLPGCTPPKLAPPPHQYSRPASSNSAARAGRRNKGAASTARHSLAGMQSSGQVQPVPVQGRAAASCGWQAVLAAAAGSTCHNTRGS